MVRYPLKFPVVLHVKTENVGGMQVFSATTEREILIVGDVSVVAEYRLVTTRRFRRVVVEEKKRAGLSGRPRSVR